MAYKLERVLLVLQELAAADNGVDGVDAADAGVDADAGVVASVLLADRRSHSLQKVQPDQERVLAVQQVDEVVLHAIVNWLPTIVS